MRVDALIEQLSAIHPKGYDLSLERISRILSKLGDPHTKIPSPIHIAGTNGKGSTLSFCRAILEADGYTVHAHTSPHLVNWHERYLIGQANGAQIVSDEQLAHAIERVAMANESQPITVYEILTAAMFLLFSENEAEFSLVEVGLGGRFDATNVIADPLVAIITTIGLDHRDQLGDCEEMIAFEKAGIIKSGRPVIVAPQDDSVLGVLEEAALSRGAPFIAANRDFMFYEQSSRFVYQDESGLLDLPLPKLRGAHQLANAATAIAAIRYCEIPIAEGAFERAMSTVNWPARMERLRQGRLHDSLDPNIEIWIDGGHNPSAGSAIASVLADLEERVSMPVFLIVGMLTTKEPLPFFKCFDGIAERVFTVPVPDTDYGYKPRDLAEYADRAGLAASACLSVSEAFGAIHGLLSSGEPARVLICGSLNLVGDVLKQNGTPPQ